MIGEVFAQHPRLWPLAWQSTLCLAVGLGASLILRRRPARAHQLLLLAIIAAVLIPTMSHVVRRNQWGLFVADRAVVRAESHPAPAQANSVRPEPLPAETAVGRQALVGNPEIQAVSETMRFEWARVVLPLWLAVSAVLLLRLTVRFLLALNLMRRSEPVHQGQITDAIDAARQRLCVGTEIAACISRRASSPVIWCWGRRPVLLIPDGSCANRQLDWPGIICHELAHWRRRDHITGLCAELLVCLLPWQPFFWLARRRLVDLSEEACDDWVIASGQVGTRYARTLLSLTPLGQAVIVPAVVTTRKGLAGRIRRIVENRCSNPQSGLKWTVAASALAACLAVTVAFAQTRPARSHGSSRSVLGHGAVIEQAEPAMMIKGRVLDPNGEPARWARVVVLPMTMYSVKARPGNNEVAHFEIPWSPSWLEPGENPCLMAIASSDENENEAAYIEVADPTQPVTIQLRPGATLTGQVVDPNGRTLACDIKVSLARSFRVPAPLFGVTWYPETPGKFTRSRLPHGQGYKLSIRAKGYQSLDVLADTMDTSKEIVDLGKIVLQAVDATHPATPEPAIDPDLQEAFQHIYRLDEGEIVKHIAVPFVLGRHEKFLTGQPNTFPGLEGGSYFQARFPFPWSGQFERISAWLGPLAQLDWVLSMMLRVPPRDVNIPSDLNVRLPSGDWMVRDGASVEERLGALEDIIHAETGRDIRFEKRQVERDTIVVTGRYKFTPLPGKDPTRLYLIAHETLQLHEDEAESLPELLRRLSDGLDIVIEDRGEPGQTATIPYTYDYTLVWHLRNEPLNKEELPGLLDNLAKQTGLRFNVERRPADTWFAVEDTGR